MLGYAMMFGAAISWVIYVIITKPLLAVLLSGNNGTKERER